MHRALGLRSHRAVRYVLPLAVLTVLGLVFGRSLLGSAPDGASASASITTKPDGVSTAAPTASPTASAAASKTTPVVSIRDLGVKKGTITLAGPTTVAKGSMVVFVLDGPKRVMKKDAKAPFTAKVNTKTLPNGAYTLTTLVVQSGTSSVATTSSLRIKNVTPKPAKKVAKPPASASTGGQDESDDASDAGGTAATETGFAAEVLALANVERSKAGCEPLALDSKLNSAAQAHSVDMATNNFFTHESQDGRTPFDRIKAAGYSFSAAAENIAAGSTTAAGAMNQWMNSPGHKANILNCTYVDLGVGYAKGVNADYAGYWTQDFGKKL